MTSKKQNMPPAKKISKSLSYWLRHKPEAEQLAMTASGWVKIEQVLAALQSKGIECDRAVLDAVVDDNDKQRFEISDDSLSIRARQGHSIDVALDWPIVDPPEQLYHGTVARFLGSIMTEGLKPMNRHHVHLSPDLATAEIVGKRRGEPVILLINAREMAVDKCEFRLSSNGVWLTDAVHPKYIEQI